MVIWKQISGGMFDLYEITLGIILATAVIVVINPMTSKPSEDITGEFTEVKRSLA